MLSNITMFIISRHHIDSEEKTRKKLTQRQHQNKEEKTNVLETVGLLIVTIAVIISISSLIYAGYVFNANILTYEFDKAMTAVWNWGIAGLVLLIIGKIVRSAGQNQLKNKKEEGEEERRRGRRTNTPISL